MKDGKVARAKTILFHYFDLVSGIKFDSGNQAEIEEIVDLIIRAAVTAARAEMREEIERLESRINDLESYHN